MLELTELNYAITLQKEELHRDMERLYQPEIISAFGSGINESNISSIARVTGTKEFHLTARKTIENEMGFRKQGISIGGSENMNEFSRKVTDPYMIRNIINILNLI